MSHILYLRRNGLKGGFTVMPKRIYVGKTDPKTTIEKKPSEKFEVPVFKDKPEIKPEVSPKPLPPNKTG